MGLTAFNRARRAAQEDNPEAQAKKGLQAAIVAAENQVAQRQELLAAAEAHLAELQARLAEQEPVEIQPKPVKKKASVKKAG